MKKMSLKRFREIKERTGEFFKLYNDRIELTDELYEELMNEIKQLDNEIHSSDLSDIPFEEYEGFYSFEFDFSGTGANIDFNIIHICECNVYDEFNHTSYVRVKGCNIRNFDFENQEYDDESFDEDFMSQYPDMFIDRELPQEVKRSFYNRYLYIGQIIRYNLYDEIEKGRASKDAEKFFSKVKPEITKKIEPDCFDLENFTTLIINDLDNYEGEITTDTIKGLVLKNIRKVLFDGFFNSFEERYVSNYELIINNPNLKVMLPEEYRIDFGQNNNLKSRYASGNMTISDVYENQEMFRGKKFVRRLKKNSKFEKIGFDGITEEKFFYLFYNFTDICDIMSTAPDVLYSWAGSINIEATKGENLEKISIIRADHIWMVYDRINSSKKPFSEELKKEVVRNYPDSELAKILYLVDNFPEVADDKMLFSNGLSFEEVIRSIKVEGTKEENLQIIMEYMINNINLYNYDKIISFIKKTFSEELKKEVIKNNPDSELAKILYLLDNFPEFDDVIITKYNRSPIRSIKVEGTKEENLNSIICDMSYDELRSIYTKKYSEERKKELAEKNPDSRLAKIAYLSDNYSEFVADRISKFAYSDGAIIRSINIKATKEENLENILKYIMTRMNYYSHDEIISLIQKDFLEEIKDENLYNMLIYNVINYTINYLPYGEIEKLICMQITFSDDQIKELIENNPDNTLKIFLFSDKINRDKILILGKYEELNNNNNTIDSVLARIYISKDKIDYDEFNQLIDEIYDLFTYNNVPEFLKTYKLFELGKYAYASNSRIASYQTLDNDSRNRIILSDLFRISLDSNNRSLREFAEIMKYGDDISKKVYQNEQLDLSGLSNEEKAIFSQYLDTLIAVNNISKGLNEDRKGINNTHNTSTDYKNLLEQYKQDNGALESSKIITGLFHGEIQGEVSPEDILQYMDKKHELSSERRREYSKKNTKGSFHLESGDFIKGIENFNSCLRRMLETGLKGGEFNREHSHSDDTPLDLDFGYISDVNIKGEQTDSEIISSTISAQYGSSWIVLKQYGKHFEEDQEDMPIKFTRMPEYWTNYPDNNSLDPKKDRYVRTGIGVEDIDYIVSNEWITSFGYEMAMVGIYIPVKNSQDELIFSEEDYNKIREQMKGLSYYYAEPFEISPKAKKMDSLFELYRNLGGAEEKIESAQKVLTGKEDTITIAKNKSTLEFINKFFSSKGIHVAENLSSDLSTDEVELINTGSTGRGTNVPGDGDFDFMLRHNLSPEILNELQIYVFSLESEDKLSLEDGFRIKNATLPDAKVVDIDVTYAKKDLYFEYSSDMCVKDRLNSVKKNSPEDYNYVCANIIMAKNILKQIGVYKKRGTDGATEHGGFGGIGVENWILQNGGSFATAIDTYLEATKDENGKDLTYSDFIERYPIYDFGLNHREGRVSHDRFSAFLGSQNDSDNHEKEFAFVKDIFEKIQKQLQEISISNNQTQEEGVGQLRKSISVEGLLKTGNTNFRVYCPENFVLMARLLSKYSERKTDESQKTYLKSN